MNKFLNSVKNKESTPKTIPTHCKIGMIALLTTLTGAAATYLYTLYQLKKKKNNDNKDRQNSSPRSIKNDIVRIIV